MQIECSISYTDMHTVLLYHGVSRRCVQLAQGVMPAKHQLNTAAPACSWSTARCARGRVCSVQQVRCQDQQQCHVCCAAWYTWWYVLNYESAASRHVMQAELAHTAAGILKVQCICVSRDRMPLRPRGALSTKHAALHGHRLQQMNSLSKHEAFCAQGMLLEKPLGLEKHGVVSSSLHPAAFSDDGQSLLDGWWGPTACAAAAAVLIARGLRGKTSTWPISGAESAHARSFHVLTGSYISKASMSQITSVFRVTASRNQEWSSWNSHVQVRILPHPVACMLMRSTLCGAHFAHAILSCGIASLPAS